MSCALTGCKSGGNQASLDVTVDVDAALSLKTVLLQAASADKTVMRNFSPMAQLSWTVQIANPKKGQLITVSAEGMKDSTTGASQTVVKYAVQVSIGPGETVPVHLKLSATCSPGPLCGADENCDDGVCKKRPVVGVADAGVDAAEAGTDVRAGTGGGGGTVGGSGGAAAGTGGGGGSGGGGSGGGGSGGGGSAGTDTGGAGGNAGNTGGAGMGGSSQKPDGGTGALVNGATCTAGGDCASGFCVDGLCCDKSCSGCNACAQAATGKPDGTCAPVTSGQDPHNTCADATATNQCGTDGMCDGAGACRKVSPSHQCTPGSCNGAVFTPASNCDGAGACKVVTTTNCGTFQCSATDGCKKTCATASDCDAGSYCNTTTGTCAVKKADGVTCTMTAECGSGICVDGVCCHTTCTGCNACSMDLTGQASGQCLPVQAGKIAHNACTASGTTCGLDGTCNGNGGCRSGAKGTACGSVCGGSTLSPKTCDGGGTCATGTGTACPGSLICASTTACKTTCGANSDCTTANCTGTTCGATKKATGVACSAGTECMTGNCVNGACCGVASCAACKSCNIAGSAGTCANKPANSTDTACAATGSNCMTGVCNASGACQASPAGTSCGADVCANGAEDAAMGLGQYTAPMYQRRLCDGATAGAAGCKLGTNQGCTGNLTCTSATACRTSCSKDADCIATYYCSGVTCVPRIESGDSVHPCTGHNQCKSRVCKAGFCALCVSDDDCPASASSCCNNFCETPGVCDDYYGNADGTLNCTLTGFCGTRHSVCGATTATHCSCGGIDCPSGSVCKPGSPPKCLVNGGQPCVLNADCISGTCGTNGTCALSGVGTVCDSDPAGVGRPSGCNASSTCIYPIGGAVSVPGINSLCE